ncbi:sigma factor-like helix-turn-helix DNA-binding protein [uncultured Gimesia sp.]|uniref:sigma factor-like helix-turn-helix DNA-binding protein n=1 Tax=uncultured Gimesia sp. TaxID=1678688 RepID=UPI00345477C2
MSDLTARQRQVITLRFGLGNDVAYSYEETARILQLSRERVCGIESIALYKLRRPSRSDILMPYWKSLFESD